MKTHKWTILVVALLMISGTAGVLAHLSGHQRLGLPGVKTRPTSDPVKLDICLPQNVLNLTSVDIPLDKSVSDYLPPDTSYSQRLYTAMDHFQTVMTVVLMGSDRTSIHKPERCLPGQGWNVDDTLSTETAVQMEKPYPYELRMQKLVGSRTVEIDGRPATKRCVYLYWFVNDKQLATQHGNRMWNTAKTLLTTGTTPRWAYISHFCVCNPGQEDEAVDRMKKFIAASTPEFQLYPGPETAAVKAPAAPVRND